MVDSDQSSDSSAAQETEVTKEELQTEIAKILKNASLKDTTTKKIIQKLEKTFGTDLSDKKKLIDKLVMDYVDALESSEIDSEDESGSEKEEKVVKEEKEEDSDSGKKKGKKAQSKKKKAPAKGKKAGGVTKRGGGGKGSGYTRAIKLSPALSELVGAEALPRHEVVKRVWAIIKERKLTDPNNRQFAICDKPLYKVIGTQRFYTFGMMKYLKNHFIDD